MEIYRNTAKNIKVYTLGIEKEYRGVSTIYDDDAKTFIYYYYPHYKRMYIIDGTEKELWIPLVENKIRVISVLENNNVVKFNHSFKNVIENKSLFYFPDSFFREIDLIMEQRRWHVSDIMVLFMTYGGNLDDFIE
jgi:hypothetical protein